MKPKDLNSWMTLKWYKKGGLSKMNIVSMTGRLVRNAHLNGSGDKRALKFTIAANSGYDAKKKSERTEFVPCVYFNPAEKLQAFLSEEGKGKLITKRGLKCLNQKSID